MTLPDWETFSGGAMKRAALWLAICVGEGEVFTKGELRSAFPDVSQIDRRVRDLRQHGWVIDTRAEDIELEIEEQRLVQIGNPVWERNYKSPTRGTAPTQRQRRQALESANHRCAWCGTAAGEPFVDDVLTVAKLTVTGSNTGGWCASCQRCKSGGAHPTSLSDFEQAYAVLNTSEREQFAKWVQRGSRLNLPLDDAWDKFRHLGASDRSILIDKIQMD